MPIQGALFGRAKSPVQLTIDSPAALRDAVGTGRLPAALVVRDEDLKSFRACPALFKDRLKKDPRKGLAALMIGQDGLIPFIETGIDTEGRLLQSVETLLENSVKAHESGIYVLSVNPDVFLTAWRSARTERGAAQAKVSKLPLSDLLPSLPGEAELSNRFWGTSEACHQVRQLILRAAKLDDPVLILGEVGTGKGVVARAIHDLGREGKPFVEVNCSAFPGELFEKELFGCEPDALPGAHKAARKGQWELAQDGTLFLDEVGDLGPELQSRILQTLQQKTIRRVGGVREIPVSARVIAASSRSLYGMVKTEKFRADLFYRLRQFVIPTPDLREDPQNLLLIAQQLWREITRAKAPLPQEILDDLRHHRWPGNVRELRSVLSALNNYFGAVGLKRDHLNAVFQHFGLVAGYGRSESPAGDPALLQVECLRKIRRADETIHVCEQLLKPLAEMQPLAVGARESLTRMRLEMQTLLQRRLYFGSAETYEAVARVEENLGQLLALPQEDPRRLSRFWRSSLGPDIHRAVTQLFDEIQKLRELQGASAFKVPPVR